MACKGGSGGWSFNFLLEMVERGGGAKNDDNSRFLGHYLKKKKKKTTIGDIA